MPTTYAEIWRDLPPDLRDRTGEAQPLTEAEWRRLLRTAMPATTNGGGVWCLPTMWAGWIADELDREADATADVDRARTLRERAERVRGRC